MIRTTAVARLRTSRPIRVGFAAASVLGIVTLAGCAGTTTAEPAKTPASTPTAGGAPAATPTAGAATGAGAAASTYKDGTYSADGSYQTPESVETVKVTVTLAGDVITAVDVTGDPQKAESKRYQGEFIGGISDEVVGKDIDTISVSRVAGSSLTSGGFNKAIEKIKAEATS